MSEQFFRAIGGGYGLRTGIGEKAQRKHEALCSTGVYCENERCPAGQAWRATTGYKLKDPVTGLRGSDAKEAVPSGNVREGRSEMLAQGTRKGQQEPSDRDGAVSVSSLSQADRKAVRETSTEARPGGATIGADAKDGKTPSLAERIARVRQRLARSSQEQGGTADRTTEPSTADSTVLPTLQAEDRRGVGARDEKAMAATKRGRPRKYVTAADRAKAYRKRKASRK